MNLIYAIDNHEADPARGLHHVIEKPNGDRVVAYSGYLHNNGGDNLTIAEYEHKTGLKLEIVTEAEANARIDAYNREKYIKPGPAECDAEHYDDLLCCLPPMDWRNGADFSRFNLSEFTTGTITTQAARITVDGVDHYFTAHVDHADRSTWMQPEQLRALVKNNNGAKRDDNQNG